MDFLPIEQGLEPWIPVSRRRTYGHGALLPHECPKQHMGEPIVGSPQARCQLLTDVRDEGSFAGAPRKIACGPRYSGGVMKYNQLGRTGLYVSEICLGAMTFGETRQGPAGENDDLYRAMGSLQQPVVDRVIGAAIDAGVNFIDTADVYANGQSELRVGLALKNLGVRRKDVVIATKAFNPSGPGPNDRGASRGHLMDAIQGSLERLGVEYVDLYQIHGYDRVTPLEETLAALEDLQHQGLVRYVGVSNWYAYRIAKALGVAQARQYAPLQTIQAHYSIAARDIEREIVPLIEEDGLGLMVWSPLAGGLLTGKYFDEGGGIDPDARRFTLSYPPVDEARARACVTAMRDVARAHGVSVARVALAWLLGKPHVMSVIIGAKTEAQLSDNLAATGLELTPDQIAQLDEVSALTPEYPSWSYSFQSRDRVPRAFSKPIRG
jgi:aryl-alcohol dehydrogenase-like predicted oxidoreductase